MAKDKVIVQSSLGILWFAGWLFTLGFLHLGFFKGILALLLWPYYIGIEMAPGGAEMAPEDLTNKARGMAVLVSCWD